MANALNSNNIVIKKIALYVTISNLKRVSTTFNQSADLTQLLVEITKFAKQIDSGNNLKVKMAKNFVVFEFSSYFDEKALCLSVFEFIKKFLQQLYNYSYNFNKINGFFINYSLHLSNENIKEVIKELKAVQYISNKKSNILLNIFRLLVSQNIYKTLRDKYSFFSIQDEFINGEFYNFYLLSDYDFIEIIENEAKNSVISKIEKSFNLNKKIQKNINNILYTTNCTFWELTSSDLNVFIFQNLHKKNIYIINANKEYLGIGNIDYSIFGEKKILLINYNKENLMPYGFIREIVKSFYNLSELTIFKTGLKHMPITPSLKKLLLLELFASGDVDFNFESIINELEGVFKQIGENYVLIFENFNSVDEGSKIILKRLLSRNLYKCNIIIEIFDDYKIFSDFNFILQLKNAHHITLKGSSIQSLSKIYNLTKIIGFEKIINAFDDNLHFTTGGFDEFLFYLISENILMLKNNEIVVLQNKNFNNPKTIIEILKYKLQSLKKNPLLFELFIFLVYSRENLTFDYFEYLNFKDYRKKLRTLQNLGFIHIDNYKIYIRNHIFYKDAFRDYKIDVIKSADDEAYIKLFSQMLPSRHPFVHNKQSQNYIKNLSYISNFALNVGAYTTHFVLQREYTNLLMNNLNLQNKKKVFEINYNLVVNLHKKAPSLVINLYNNLIYDAKDDNNINILENLYLYNGISSFLLHKYINAYNSFNEYEKLLENREIDFNEQKFNYKLLFVLLKKTQLLFEMGEINKSVEVFNNIIKTATSINFSKIINEKNAFGNNMFYKDFNLCLYYYIFGNILSLNSDFYQNLQKIEQLYNGDSVDIEIFKLFYHLFKTGEIYNDINNIETSVKTVFSLLLLNLYKLTSNFFSNDQKNNIYEITQAKRLSYKLENTSLNLLLDLAIGSLYGNLDETQKALGIIEDVIKKSKKMNLKNINLFANYLLIKLYCKKNQYEEANEILDQIVYKIEHDLNVLELLKIQYQLLRCKIYIETRSNYDITHEILKECYTCAKKYKLKYIMDKCDYYLRNMKNYQNNSI